MPASYRKPEEYGLAPVKFHRRRREVRVEDRDWENFKLWLRSRLGYQLACHRWAEAAKYSCFGWEE